MYKETYSTRNGGALQEEALKKSGMRKVSEIRGRVKEMRKQ
jgi:hypothetical protein